MSSPREAVVHRATSRGVGGIAVFELYGEAAEHVLESAFEGSAGVPAGTAPGAARSDESSAIVSPPRLGRLLDVRGDPVDDVIVAPISPGDSLFRLAGWSISCHGGPAVSDRVERALVDRGARAVRLRELLTMARESGAMDVVVEEVTPLAIESRTLRATRYLLRVTAGELSRRLRELAERVSAEGGEPRREALDALEAMIAMSGPARRLAEPLRLLIAGRPNAGKSTLFNALLGSERVVVSERPGTTRDVVSELIEIEGFPVRLMDSAGLRPGAERDEVERLGIESALGAARDAVVFATDHDVLDGGECEFIAGEPADTVAIVRTKLDVAGSPRDRGCRRAGTRPPALASGDENALCSARPLAVSALTGAGLDALREHIRTRWLGPAESEELPALPCTEALVARARELLRRWTELARQGESPPRAAFRVALGDCFPGCDGESDVAP